MKNMTLEERCAAITDGIVADIKKRRACRYESPWANGGQCVNAYSKRLYVGELNTLILSCAEGNLGYATSRWLTSLQAEKAGGWVKPGERPTMIIFGTSDGSRGRGFGRMVALFNIEQCGGLPNPPPIDPELTWAFPRLQILISNMGVDFRIGGRSAFFHKTENYIQVPSASSFFRPNDWQRTTLHELAHSTAHSSRLNRRPLDRVKHVADAKEEILVELATTYLLAGLRIHTSTLSPSYIKSWLRYAKVDPEYLLQLFPAAMEITEYILSFDKAAKAATTGNY